MSACKAPDRIGVLRLRPQAAIGTPIALQSTDGLIVRAAPAIEAIGEGRVDLDETESPLPGGFDPVFGSYGEALTLTVAVPIVADGQLDADNAIVRLLRACGCGVAISGGEATVNALTGGCVGLTAADRVPLTIEWAQEGGLTHIWKDCVGALTQVAGESSGQAVLMTFVLHCRVVSRVATTALPAVTFPGQQPFLVAKNSTLTLGDGDAPATLYAWTLTTGLAVQEVPSQLAEGGLGLPFAYQSEPASFDISTAQENPYSADQWARFFGMTSLGDLALKIKGQSATDILEIEAPRPFTSPQELGAEAGHRTDGREWLLKPDGDDPAWTLVIREEVAS